MGNRLTALIPGFEASRVNRLPWKYFAEILTHLTKTGWDVRVITDSASTVNGWTTDHVGAALPLSPWAGRRLRLVIDQGQPDIVLAPMGATSLAHRLVLNSLRVPLVGLVLQYPYRLPQIPWSRLVYRETLEQAWLVALGGLVPDPVKGWGLKAGARLIVSSRDTQERLRALGVASDDILYAPPGLDAEAFERPPEDRRVVHPRVLYFGSCLRLRGIDQVLEAFRLLQKDHPNLELVILDRGDGGFEVASELRRKRISRGVTLVQGPLPKADLRGWIGSATVALLPFRMALQDSPLTIQEAQALGTPVVSCQVPGVAEGVEAPGVVIPSPDPSTIAEVVEGILELHPISAQMRSSLAHRTRTRMPTWEETASTVETLLEELVQP